MSPALVTLNMRELDRLKVIQAVVDIGLKPGHAAGRLGLTVRQVERLVARYRESGAAGLASRKRRSPGNRKLDEGLAVRALTTIRERYADFGPTLACEKLRSIHFIRQFLCSHGRNRVTSIDGAGESQRRRIRYVGSTGDDGAPRASIASPASRQRSSR